MKSEINPKSAEQAIQAARNSVRTIKILCDSYDNGHFDVSRDIATIIHRLVVEELTQTKKRREIDFISYSFPADPHNIVTQFLVTTLNINFPPEVDQEKIVVTHMPLLDENAQFDGRFRTVKWMVEWFRWCRRIRKKLYLYI